MQETLLYESPAIFSLTTHSAGEACLWCRVPPGNRITHSPAVEFPFPARRRLLRARIGVRPCLLLKT